jgi:hypothetical protein
MLPKAEKACWGPCGESAEPTAAANSGADRGLARFALEDSDEVFAARRDRVPAGSGALWAVALPISGTSSTTPCLRTDVKPPVLSVDAEGVNEALAVAFKVFMIFVPILAQIEKEPALVQEEIFRA